ncbi:MAG: SPFH domain-containing protein [Methylophilaceae bacterium]|jgi:flotillin|nr:SPFH domain-containing protein [Methyloradius sp.]
MDDILLNGYVYGAAVVFVLVLITFFLRRVVATNEVHIVQSSKKSVSYGNGLAAGNTYYEFPSWLPIIGVLVSKYPVSVFTEELTDYEAYDQGRLPFVLDVKAFFRISDSNTAAQRVSSFSEMRGQLNDILKGCIRSILATNDIESIMQDRAKFGDAFTKEVDDNLRSWGVSTVKSVELMDIRDAQGSTVIKNIMEKKKSMIEMESRIEVAKNLKLAEISEIEAKRETDVKKQDALQQVGLRTAEKDREVGIAQEQSTQSITDQKKVTASKEMEVKQVTEVAQAEIDKKVQIVNAEKARDTNVINAEAAKTTKLIDAEAEKESVRLKADGEKASTVLIADGKYQAKKFEAEGIEAEGLARAVAEKELQLAPVAAQIELANKIGENQNYQQYLTTLKQFDAMIAVGIEQAKALEKADIKVIANAGSVNSGMNKVLDLFSSQGGTSIGSMLEAFANTDTGKSLLDKLTGDTGKAKK